MSSFTFPSTLTEAREMIGRRPRRKLAHNTYLEPRGESAACRFHATDIATFVAESVVRLDSGGWRTLTTRDRLVQIVRPVHLWQERGTWYLREPGADQPVIYCDGCAVDLLGATVHNALPTSAQKQIAAYRRRVGRYVDDFASAMVAGKVPPPDGGDCFYCYMRGPVRTVQIGEHTAQEMTPGTETDAPWGEGSRNADHIKAHIQERYFVPSLLFRAVELYGSPALKWSCGSIWTGQGKPFLSGDYLERDLRRALRKHVYTQLGLPR